MQKDDFCYRKQGFNLLSLASFLWDIGKRYRTRLDATERGVGSDSSLFAHRMYFLNLNEIETHYPTPLKTEMDI